MWNLSYRWQQHARVAAGLAVLLAFVAALILAMRTPPARRTAAGAREMLSELRASSDTLAKATVPASLRTRPGTLVYLDRADGVAQVIGRVVEVESADQLRDELSIRLMGPADGAGSPGGILKGAAASLDLRDAMRLLITPDTPNEEVMLARDTIWPSVRENVLPAMTEALIREAAKELAALGDQDQALVARSLETLHEELKPLENQLIDRLARRAWDVIGVKGLASGIWRATSDDVQNKGGSLSGWFWQLFGRESEARPAAQPFLSDETREALQTALKEESIAFWKQHRAEIVDSLLRVVAERRPDFEEAFSERWAGLLYERAVVPAWQAGQDKVLESVQSYANDFATRRLLTKDNGPRLLFAFALRSSLKISGDPLLVFNPGGAKNSGRIVYEPLLH